MTHGTPRAARLLFVIDHDFGALGTVMYLLHRQPLSASTTLLLPRRAYELNKVRLPIASRPYESLRDILDVVESESPDVVFLFSGYLFSAQGLLTFRALRKLIRALRQRGCKVATSDPYLGTHYRIGDADMPVGQGAIQRNLERRLARLPLAQGLIAQFARFYNDRKLKREVFRVAESLKDVTQIYPVPIEPSEGGAKRVSFFNPLFIRTPDELRSNAAAVAGPSDPALRGPRWLFVLAQFDLEFQEKKYGRKGFVELVAGKIREALDLGKLPMFIGPAAVTEELSRRFARDAGVSFLPTCSFEEFQQRLLDAEFVFYWQIFSTSAFFRLWNGLPVFFFDQGHNARLLKPLREAGLKHYYLAGSPIYLDIEKPLDAAELTRLGAGFRELALDIRERLAGLPTPEEMVKAIMEAG